MASGTITKRLQFNRLAAVSATNSATEHDCPWQDYDLLFITASFYSNRMATVVFPVHGTSYSFEQTSANSRFLCPVFSGSTFITQIELYQSGEGKVMVRASATATGYGVIIEGMKI